MQDASDALATALASGSVTWSHYLGADWDGDEFDEGDDTIDDLSGQAGTITVQQSLDDGLPDEISFMSGGVPTLRATLGGKHDKMARSPLTVAQYFSPFRSDSPLFGYERDLAAVTGEIGAVTLTGVEQVVVFHGVMSDIPVSGGRATLLAGSQTRRELSQVVQPRAWARDHNPAFSRITGLTATHVITWALLQARVHCAPPPQGGTFVYLPLHGSGHSQIPDTVMQWGQQTPGIAFGFRQTAAGSQTDVEPIWIRGPYVGASYGAITADEIRGLASGISDNGAATMTDRLIGMEPGGIWDQATVNAGAVLRLEMWVRGDTTVAAASAPFGTLLLSDVTNGPQPGATSQIAGFTLRNDLTSSGVALGVDDSHVLYVSCWDNTGSNHKVTGPTMPTDGEWHFVGLAIQGSTRNVWFNLDGAVTNSTFASPITVANLPTSRTAAYVYSFNLFVPISEVHLTGYTDDSGNPLVAHPTSGNPWVNAQAWTQQADVYPSALQLAATSDTTPSEVWQLIASYAQSEFAAMRIDEHDIFHYWPRGYLATVAGQTVAQVLTSDQDSNVPDVILDKTRIRNVCRVSYQDARIDQVVNEEVVEYKNILVIPPGESVLLVPFDRQTVWVMGGPMELLTATQVAGGGLNPQTSYLSLNADTLGTSAYATTAEVTAEIVDWWGGGCIIEFNNVTGVPWYLVNSGDTYPYLGVFGQIVTYNQTAVTEEYEAGVDARGVRGLTVNLPRINRIEDATRMARRIVVPQSVPVPIIEKMQLFGDPRRQPGDIIQYDDEFETGVGGLWRVYGLAHQYEGSSYTQGAVAKKAELVGEWGDGVSVWGGCVWAGQELP